MVVEEGVIEVLSSIIIRETLTMTAVFICNFLYLKGPERKSDVERQTYFTSDRSNVIHADSSEMKTRLACINIKVIFHHPSFPEFVERARTRKQ